MNSNNTETNVVPTTAVRGRKQLKVKFPKGPFTVEELFEMNNKATGKGTVKCVLTARNHIKRGLATGKLVKLAEKATKGTVGAPAYRFQLKAAVEYNEARKAKKAVVKVATTPQPAQVESPVAVEVK